ncbi:hypothetical protein [Rhodopirellula europaea]|uniref:hypothetical protein n=1 Tax=Rhodopirellula europaea TaxID=1263866 RepID=UPI0030ED1B26
MNQPKPSSVTASASHPLLARLVAAIEQGQKFEVDVRNEEEIFGLDGYQLSIWEVGGDKPISVFPWDAEINEELIDLRVRSKDLESEANRFAIRLRDELGATETRYGNGFFNRTLVDLITESYLDKYPDIKNSLERTHSRQVERTAEYHECRDTIAYVIGKRSRELTRQLEYDETTMQKILSKAIARYIDNRFSLSQRKQMGLL